METADLNGNLPSDGFQVSDGFYREDYLNASWMPHQQAVHFIVQCLREFPGVTD